MGPDIFSGPPATGPPFPTGATPAISNFCYIEARHLNNAFGVFNVPTGAFPQLLENDLLRALRAAKRQAKYPHAHGMAYLGER